MSKKFQNHQNLPNMHPLALDQIPWIWVTRLILIRCSHIPARFFVPRLWSIHICLVAPTGQQHLQDMQGEDLEDELTSVCISYKIHQVQNQQKSCKLRTVPFPIVLFCVLWQASGRVSSCPTDSSHSSLSCNKKYGAWCNKAAQFGHQNRYLRLN